MDSDENLAQNNVPLVSSSTMGNILSSTTNENSNLEDQSTSKEPSPTGTSTDLDSLENSDSTSSSNILKKLKKRSEPKTTKDDDVEIYTKGLSMQDINLIIMGKSSPKTISTDKNVKHEKITKEFWLDEANNIKVDKEEDYDNIVKSLETAIVATENYTIDSNVSSSSETKMFLSQTIPRFESTLISSVEDKNSKLKVEQEISSISNKLNIMEAEDQPDNNNVTTEIQLGDANILSESENLPQTVDFGSKTVDALETITCEPAKITASCSNFRSNANDNKSAEINVLSIKNDPKTILPEGTVKKSTDKDENLVEQMIDKIKMNSTLNNESVYNDKLDFSKTEQECIVNKKCVSKSKNLDPTSIKSLLSANIMESETKDVKVFNETSELYSVQNMQSNIENQIINEQINVKRREDITETILANKLSGFKNESNPVNIELSSVTKRCNSGTVDDVFKEVENLDVQSDKEIDSKKTSSPPKKIKLVRPKLIKKVVGKPDIIEEKQEISKSESVEETKDDSMPSIKIEKVEAEKSELLELILKRSIKNIEKESVEVKPDTCESSSSKSSGKKLKLMRNYAKPKLVTEKNELINDNSKDCFENEKIISENQIFENNTQENINVTSEINIKEEIDEQILEKQIFENDTQENINITSEINIKEEIDEPIPEKIFENDTQENINVISEINMKQDIDKPMSSQTLKNVDLGIIESKNIISSTDINEIEIKPIKTDDVNIDTRFLENKNQDTEIVQNERIDIKSDVEVELIRNVSPVNDIQNNVEVIQSQAESSTDESSDDENNRIKTLSELTETEQNVPVIIVSNKSQYDENVLVDSVEADKLSVSLHVGKEPETFTFSNKNIERDVPDCSFVENSDVCKEVKNQEEIVKVAEDEILIDDMNMKETESSKICEVEVNLSTPIVHEVSNISNSIIENNLYEDMSTKSDLTAEKLEIKSNKSALKSCRESDIITQPLTVEIDDDMSSLKSCLTPQKSEETIPKLKIKNIPHEQRSSPKITIKPIKPPEDMIREQKNYEDSYPKVTIKPIKQDPLKITITKQKTDDNHSILKIYKPDESHHEEYIPKFTIKPIPKGDEMSHSPKRSLKLSKPHSPKITVKPVIDPNEKQSSEMTHSPKLTIKPIVNSEENYPRVTIKPILRPEESKSSQRPSSRMKSMAFDTSSGITMEPIQLTSSYSPKFESQMSPVKSSSKLIEESLSPKLTIKPIIKTCEIVQSEDGISSPLKLTIKPILKPEDTYQSPKITIKPIIKPDSEQLKEESEKPERIILKIQKTSLASPKERTSTQIKEIKREPDLKIEPIIQDEKIEKLGKIKLKLLKEEGHAQIIGQTNVDQGITIKRTHSTMDSNISEKRSRSDRNTTEILHTSDISINIVEPNARPLPKAISDEVTIVKIDKPTASSSTSKPLYPHSAPDSKFKNMLLHIQNKPDITCTPHIQHYDSSSSDDVKIIEVFDNEDKQLMLDESNSEEIIIINQVIHTNPFHDVEIIKKSNNGDHSPKKRGRPRKNPLEIKPEVKEDCVEVTRPKRTCRSNVTRIPFPVKERKPRGGTTAGRGRGGPRGRGSKTTPKPPKEPKTPRGKALRLAKALAKQAAEELSKEIIIDQITIDESNDTSITGCDKSMMNDSDIQIIEPTMKTPIKEENKNICKPPPPVVYEEETRMSADNSSRAQTPARQVLPPSEGPEESQSSMQSTATTESGKIKKGRLEIADLDTTVTGVEQIAEYSWGGGGPYMLQEQIAQYLGVKSFKRKYPGLHRRSVEMQERDFIREKGLVSESMCDLGLTAVPSSEILDIMYTDFQDKYEEYRKHMRDKQSKEISSKQKAISLATSQEKNKIDYKERAMKSAASWNNNFNRARRESRRCCMDLQTLTVNFPIGKIHSKLPQKNPPGHYPIALVPGQYTDYYKTYSSSELHYLPLNTVRYGPVLPNQQVFDFGQSDGSQSDSDSSSSSDSDSSDDSMSTVDEMMPCKFPSAVSSAPGTPKSRV